MVECKTFVWQLNCLVQYCSVKFLFQREWMALYRLINSYVQCAVNSCKYSKLIVNWTMTWRTAGEKQYPVCSPVEQQIYMLVCIDTEQCMHFSLFSSSFRLRPLIVSSYILVPFSSARSCTSWIRCRFCFTSDSSKFSCWPSLYPISLSDDIENSLGNHIMTSWHPPWTV